MTIVNDEMIRESVQRFLDFLLQQNRQLNLVSRRITPAQLQALADETLRLAPLISGNRVVDAGSGNGLLGIVLALFFPMRTFILLESIEKKARFLRLAVSQMELRNTEVCRERLENFRFPAPGAENTLVARGFPSLSGLVEPLLRGKVREVVCITSLKKIEKLEFPLEKTTHSIYNIPSRDVIKILKMENVSRETINPDG
ncbi:MAG: class I SAM-dependent methyltransferase [Acidobacteriota bacterium]|jgi:16S rRNA (guanine(527)-N(7))-methyltransferase RsmG|nr:class I SAM-dependent methyltransferase [Acidobacteriota bacterium]